MEPEFYELIGFNLTHLGDEVFKNHGCWGYFEEGMPELEEYLKGRYEKYKGRRRGKLKNQTFEEYESEFFKHELKTMQYPCLFASASRGYFKTIEDFEKPFIRDGYTGYYGEEPVKISLEDAASYVCEGYYEMLQLVGRGYGLDNNWYPEEKHIYSMNRGEKVYKKVDNFPIHCSIAF